MRDAIDRFVQTVIEASDHPFTADEIAVANQARTFDDPFDP